jgi:hypothetical protein
MPNGLIFDVEDYFHVSALGPSMERNQLVFAGIARGRQHQQTARAIRSVGRKCEERLGHLLGVFWYRQGGLAQCGALSAAS